MKTAVIYTRYSSDNQREESIQAQVRACEDYARQHGLAVLRVYTDEARSATSDDRPGFLELFSDIKRGLLRTDYLLVHKFDRFARNRFDSAIYKRELKRKSIRLVSVTQPLDDSPESAILESVLEGMDEYYSKNLARETMKGLRENAFQAKFNGGTPPLGYDVVDGQYVVNESEAAVIRLIFDMFIEGYGYIAILDKLNSLGYRTKRGGAFGKNGIYELLRNAKYAGIYVFNRAPQRVEGKRNWRARKREEDIITIPNALPAIISEERYKVVQATMDRRKQPRQNKESLYLLTGKLTCGVCGSAVVGNSTRRTPGAAPSRFYECNRKLRKRDCLSHRVSKHFAEKYVLDQIDALLTPDSIESMAKYIMAALNAKRSTAEDAAKKARAELVEVDRKIANLVRALEDGAIDYAMLGPRLKELKNQKLSLESHLDAIKSPLYSVTQERVREYLLATYDASRDRTDTVAMRKLIDQYVTEVTVLGKEDLDVVLKFDLAGSSLAVRIG